MRAVVITGYQQPLEIGTLPDPEPGPGDAIIRTEACGICRTDWHLWQHEWTWIGMELTLPRVPGHEFGGEVVECGKPVTRFRPGGGIGVHHDGGFGELVRVPSADSTQVRLPGGVDAYAAAALGGLGLSVVPIASAIGARVMAVRCSDDKLALARDEGAEATVKAGPNAPAEAIEISNGGAAVTMAIPMDLLVVKEIRIA